MKEDSKSVGLSDTDATARNMSHALESSMTRRTELFHSTKMGYAKVLLSTMLSVGAILV